MYFLAASSEPPFSVTEPQRARKFQRAPPEVLGLAVTTSTLGLLRSSQVFTFLGLPARTMKITVELVAMELLGSSFSQPASIRPAFSILATSAVMARATTSASRPSITARLWEPDPP